MKTRVRTISQTVTGLALLMALAACGSGLSSTSSSSGSGSGSGSGGSTTPGTASSIVFAPSATTNGVIALQGTGGTTSAEVTFIVVDATGTAVPGIVVSFTIVPATGDASLTKTSDTTDADGKVSTFVVSGNEHGSVTVEAAITTAAGKQTASSNRLVVTTGIPTQGNFNIAVTNLNAPNAGSTQGITDTVTVQLADRFSNPAPDGTAVSFFTNSGTIQGQCFTAGGSCSVTWSSAGSPNPVDNFHKPGRAEILAYTVGEESFTDVDGDGVFDHSDIFTANSGADIDAFTDGNPVDDDIGEIYLDGPARSESANHATQIAAYVAGDFIVDFNKNSVRDAPDGKFYGFGCKGTSTVPCGSTTTKEIGKQACILMSTAGTIITVFDDSNPLSPVPVTDGKLSVTTSTYIIEVTDANGNAPAANTQVSVTEPGIAGFTVITPGLPFTYGDTSCGSGAAAFTFNLVAATPPVTGFVVVTVKTPGTNGATTTAQFTVLP